MKQSQALEVAQRLAQMSNFAGAALFRNDSTYLVSTWCTGLDVVFEQKFKKLTGFFCGFPPDYILDKMIEHGLSKVVTIDTGFTPTTGKAIEYLISKDVEIVFYE